MDPIQSVDSEAIVAVAVRLRAGETVDVSATGMPRGPFVTDVLGLEFGQASHGRLTAHLVLDERHHQPFGIVHGGIWCAVVETLASVAAALHAPDGHVVVGVNNSTDFLRPHRTGRVEGEASLIHLGRTQQLWQVTLRRDDDALVARGQVRLQHVASR